MGGEEGGNSGDAQRKETINSEVMTLNTLTTQWELMKRHMMKRKQQQSPVGKQ